jgi:UPF0716 family protein affecting phage T7 exclusion
MPLSFQLQGRRWSVKWAPLWLAAEILVTLAVIDAVGFGRAVLAQIVFMLIGAALLRRLGRGAAAALNRAGKDGLPHNDSLVDGMLSGLAAVLLIFPGFLTTLAALPLLVPPLRRFVAKRFGLAKLMPRQTPGAVDLDPAEWSRAPDADDSGARRLR